MKNIRSTVPTKEVTFDNTKLDLKTGELVEVPSMTKQEFVAECDINNIVKQYSATGQLKHISARAAQGQYMDLPDDLDFQTSLEIVRQAQEAFATLPSATRARFERPQQFLAFLSDPANQERLSSSASLPTGGHLPKEPETDPTAKSGVEGESPSEGA